LNKYKLIVMTPQRKTKRSVNAILSPLLSTLLVKCLFMILMKPIWYAAAINATLYSIVESAKANCLVLYDYLMHVMNEIMVGNTEPEQRLPWKVNLG